MSDPFRRVRPGEAVRIHATAWNALLDLVRPVGQTADTATVQQQLPAQVICCAPAVGGLRRPVWGEVVRLVSAGDDATAPATVPLAPVLALSATERRLVAGYRPRYSLLTPDGAGVDLDDPLAVCVDGVQLRFATAGLAWCRVRALRGWHRFARRPLPQPGDGATELAWSAGCLDSCGAGPVQIIGWAPANFDPARNGQQLASTQRAVSTYSGGIGWALVRL